MLLHLILLAQIGLGGMAGLNGYPTNAPTISALTQSVDANTVVLSWTTSIASDTRASCGTEQSPDNGIAAASTSHQIVVAGLAPSTLYTCTVTSGRTSQTIAATTTAFATSTPITGLVYGTWQDYNTVGPPAHTMTGDTYYNTRSNDGVTYLTTMDTSGWNGLPNFSASLMLAKFTSESPLTVVDVNLLSGYSDVVLPDAKAGGLISVAGTLYALFNRLVGIAGNYEPILYGSIISSPDHGVTWNNFQAPNTYTTTGAEMVPISTALWPQSVSFTNFSCNHFIMYGADDGTTGEAVANNRFNDGNAYIYLIALGYGSGTTCSVNNNDSAYLMRVPRSQIGRLNVTDYQYWVSGDGNLDSNWTYTASSAGAILTNAAKLGWMSIQYIPTLNRYLMMTFYYPSGAGNTANSVQLGYESSTPWGPWTLIATNTFTGTGYYSPMILQDSALAATFGTTTMTLMSTQNFANLTNYHLFYNTMTVTH